MSKNAKISSKNNPDTRGQKNPDKYFGDKIVIPALCIIDNREFRAAAYKDTFEPVTDVLGNILAWSKVSASCTTTPTTTATS